MENNIVWLRKCQVCFFVLLVFPGLAIFSRKTGGVVVFVVVVVIVAIVVNKVASS